MEEQERTGSPDDNAISVDNMQKLIEATRRFASINKMVLRDVGARPSFSRAAKFTKENIQAYIANPSRNVKNLREVVRYLYGVSPHFHRLIQYFVGLTDWSYIVSPYKIEPKKVNTKTTGKNYKAVLNTLSAMHIKTQFAKILTVCLREDVFFGTMYISDDDITIRQLPDDFCRISSIENNVFNIEFNFAYFDSRKPQLDDFPPEFKAKYQQYARNKKEPWVELDSPTSFAIKCNADIWEYAMPPFAGVLREIYDIEDYAQLRLVKTALDNYALLLMKIPMNDEGGWLIDFEKAQGFWRNLDGVLPAEIGSVLSPMPIDKISLERARVGENDSVAEAEENLFTAAGVSSLLFNNEKASANALELSIKVDQEITYSIVKSIED